MRDTGIFFWALPVARTLAGFILSTMLGIAGGWLALIFNAMTGYPWAFGLHQNIYFVGVGAGAGVGAYIGWANFAVHPRYVAATVLLVVIGGVVGAYLWPTGSRRNRTCWDAGTRWRTTCTWERP